MILALFPGGGAGRRRGGGGGEPELPAPDVRLAPDFLSRVERLAATLAAARERREGAGRGALAGGGEEFVGYRPYRPGEDLRRLDWSLLARLDRPFVRVTRREAGERWAVLLDASASMGVGPPGKLQRGAEVAGALACLGLRLKATVDVLVSDAGERGALSLSRRRDAAALVRFLDGRRAAGSGGVRELVAAARRYAEAGRVFVVGDLLDVEPRELLGLGRRGRELLAAQLLAPVELEPRELGSEVGAVDWWDPEGGERLELALDARAVDEYEARLEARLEAWRSTCARHGVSYGVWSTRVEFEDVVHGLLRA